MGIKDWDKNERPRERLLQKGPNALTPAEMLAIILRTGNHQKSAVDLGLDLLQRFGGIERLCAASDQELQEVPGIGPAKTAQIRAAIGFSNLRTIEKAKGSPQLCDPQAVFELVKCYIANSGREEFWCVMLNQRKRLIEVSKISSGSATKNPVNLQTFVKLIIKHNAVNLILAHNHPSGNPTPSPEDKNVTRKLIELCRPLEIEILDHLIIGGASYFSFQQAGLIASL